MRAIIDSKEQLVDLVNEFEIGKDLRTRFFETDLKTFATNYLGITHPNEIRTVMQSTPHFNLVGNTFSNDSVISFSKIDKSNTIRYWDFIKLNCSYNLVLDLRQGKKFLDIFTVTVFPNGKVTVDPGGTRMMFMNIYQGPVQVMLVQHSGSLEHANKFFNLKSVQDFDFDTTNLEYYRCNSNDVEAPGRMKFAQENVDTHYLLTRDNNSLNRIYTDVDYLETTLGDRVFEKTDNEIICDGDVFMRKDANNKFVFVTE